MTCPGCSTDNDETAESCFTCGYQLVPTIRKGVLLAARYEIVSLLGRGGMGVVYKALDRVLEETVALKVLRMEIGRSQELTRRFRSEIKLARKVRHPNVCAIHEYGEEGQHRFISMELVEGVDFKQILRERGALPASEAFDIGIQVARGLEAIHAVGIVHRDLKTPNLMSDGRGVVRLMDFGIAKQFGGEDSSGATATGHIVGTPEYMSPEQVSGHKLDGRSDIYALGIVLFELFSGQVPFRGDTPVATLMMHLQEPPPLDRAEALGIPAAVVPVLRKALAKSRDERYATARDVVMDLIRAREASGFAPLDASSLTYATPSPAPRRGPTTWSRTLQQGRPARGVARQWLLAGASALVAVLATGWWLWPREKSLPAEAAPSTPPTIAAIEPGEPAPQPITLPPASASPMATSPPVAATPGAAVSRPAAASQRPVAQRPDGGIRPSPTPRAERDPPAPLPAVSAAVPTPAPSSPPSETPRPAPATTGILQIRVKPWADVTVDDVAVGQAWPRKELTLAAGPHSVRLSHLDFRPLQRRVLVRAWETTVLDLDLNLDAIAN